MSDLVTALNVAGIVGFVALMAVLMRARQFRFLALNLLVGQVWSLVSCLYLTSGPYNPELGYATWQNLSPLSLAFYNALFFFAAWLVLRRLRKTIADSVGESPAFGGWVDMAVLVGAVAAVAYLVVVVVVNGPPLVSGEARQRFIERALQNDASTRVASGSVGFIALVLGVLFVHGVQARRASARLIRLVSLGAAAALVGEQVLAGEKFSGIVWVAFFFSLPYLLFAVSRPRVLGRIAMVATLLGAAFGVTKLVAMFYTDSAAVTVGARVLVLQGELYWVVHERVFNDFTPNTAQLAKEFTTADGGPGQRVGIWYLMERYGDPTVVFSSIIAGFTGGYPAIVLELFGPYWAIPVQLFMGLIFGVLALLLVRYIRHRQYLRLYLAGTLFTLANSVFVMGTMADLFKPTTVAKLVILASMEVGLFLSGRVARLPVRRPAGPGLTGPRPSAA